MTYIDKVDRQRFERLKDDFIRAGGKFECVTKKKFFFFKKEYFQLIRKDGEYLEFTVSEFQVRSVYRILYKFMEDALKS